MCLGVFFIMIWKVGKFLYYKILYLYDFEYGSVVIEMYNDVVLVGDCVLIYDDLFVIGGLVVVVVEFIIKCGGMVVGFNFLVGLSFLEGEGKLKIYFENIVNLVVY